MKRSGFTIIEVLVVVAIFAALVGLYVVRVTGIERRAPLSATVDTIISDLRSQQTRAMVGAARGVGITFQASAYTLVPGNSVVSLPTNITLSPAGSSMFFANGSGDVSGITTLTLTQTLTGEQKTITINRYGAVTQVQ